ncbi:MAG: amidohydrolase family protein [Sulfolobales archaeon]
MNYIDAHVHPLTDVDKIIENARRAGVSKIILLATEIPVKVVESPKVRHFLERVSSESLFTVNLEIYKMFGTTDLLEAFRRFYTHLSETYGDKRYLSEDVIAISREYSGNGIEIIPIGSIYPELRHETLEKRLRDLLMMGVRGIKLLPTLQLFDPLESEGFLRVLEFAEKNDLLIIIHTGCDPGPFEIPLLSQWASPSRLAKALEIFSPKIVLAHTGSYCAYRYGIWFNEAIRIMRKYDNVYGDSSAVNDYLFYTESVVRKLREEVGLERILFGSDYPVVQGGSIDDEVRVVLESPYLSSREKEMILRDNASELLKSIRRT